MSDMTFGVCTSFRDKPRLLEAKKSGADYCEIDFTDFASATDDEVKDFIDFSKAENFPSLAANRMFPGDIPLVGAAPDYARIDEFVDSAAEKFTRAGGKTVVFGSGKARTCPEGFSKEKATEQLVELCANHIAPYMEKHGIICAIEPLRREECNMITTAKLGYELCKAVDSPYIRLLVDFYHFCSEGEELESILNYKGCLQHIHIASAKNQRKYPAPNDGENYKGFFEMLRKAEYGPKLVSLEGRSNDFAKDTEIAFKLLRTL